MSKGNLFLGLGTGKIGSIVLYRAFGEERARSYIRKKKNPRTWRQAVQRVCMKTAQVAYSSLLPFCRETFQGYDAGTPCQSAFISRNVSMLRGRVQTVIDSGDPAQVLASDVGNYCGKDDELLLLNPYIVSDGGLSSVGATFANDTIFMDVTISSISGTSTYAEVCTALGLQRGDCMDFVTLATNTVGGLVTSVSRARVVLEPSDGDMSSRFLTDAVVNKPNAANFGEIEFTLADPVEVHLPVPGGIAQLAGACVVSRQFGALRQYSPETLAIDPTQITTHFTHKFGDAVASLMGDDVYLNAG